MVMVWPVSSLLCLSTVIDLRHRDDVVLPPDNQLMFSEDNGGGEPTCVDRPGILEMSGRDNSTLENLLRGKFFSASDARLCSFVRNVLCGGDVFIKSTGRTH